MVKQATEALPRPSIFVPGIPGSVEITLLKALAKKPSDRFADMGGFLRALDAIAHGKEIPVSEITSTVTVDDSDDTFATHQVKEPTYSTVDQNAHQRTRTQTQPPAPPRPTLGWLPWAAGGLVLCLMGVIAVAIIAMVPPDQGGSSSYAAEPSSYQPSITDTPIQGYESPVSWPTDTSLPVDVPPAIDPTSAWVPNPTQPPSCSGAKYKTRIQPKRNARICTNLDRVVVRETASGDAPEILSLYPGTTVLVLDGPVCADNSWWWKIRVRPNTKISDQNHVYDDFWKSVISYEGWAREGWDNTDKYYLCP